MQNNKVAQTRMMTNNEVVLEIPQLIKHEPLNEMEGVMVHSWVFKGAKLMWTRVANHMLPR